MFKNKFEEDDAVEDLRARCFEGWNGGWWRVKRKSVRPIARVVRDSIVDLHGRGEAVSWVAE